MAGIVVGTAVVERASDVVQRTVAGEAFLVPVRGRLADLQELFVLNEVGSWIWERLDGRTSQEAITESLTAEFGVEAAQARRDLEEFLEQLVSAGLAQVIAADVG
jgi:hypothetical protein